MQSVKSALFASIVLVSFSTVSSEILLTDMEQSSLLEINDSNELKRFLTYKQELNESSVAIETDKWIFSNEIAGLDSEFSRLTKDLINSIDNEQLIAQLQEISTNRKQAAVNLENAEAELVELTSKIEKNNDLLANQRRSLFEQRKALYKEVRVRLLSESGEEKTTTKRGKLDCSDMNARSCFKKYEPQIVQKTLGEGARLIQSHVEDMVVNYHGEANYQVNLTYISPYTRDTDAKLKQQLGLDEVEVVLRSNLSSTNFYIDSSFVGKGSKVTTRIPYGKYVIEARSGEQRESTIEQLTKDVELTYNFSHVPEPENSRSTNQKSAHSGYNLTSVRDINANTNTDTTMIVMPTFNEIQGSMFSEAGNYVYKRWSYPKASQLCQSISPKNSKVLDEANYKKVLGEQFFHRQFGLDVRYWLDDQTTIFFNKGGIQKADADGNTTANVLCLVI